jgi:hypothetical protein
MPNWCDNSLTISGPAKDLDRFMTEQGRCLSLNKINPTPEELMSLSAPFSGSKEDGARLLALYGATDWYGWRVGHWGTKWDIEEGDGELIRRPRSIVCRFITAYSPPDLVIMTLSKMYPTLKFVIKFNEPGMGLNGKDTYIGMNSDEVDARVSETSAEWNSVVDIIKSRGIM